jgi:hypothetical protein
LCFSLQNLNLKFCSSCKVLIVQRGPDYCLVVCRGPAVETEMTHKDYDMSELKKLLKSFSVGAAMTVTIHAYMAVVPALLLQIVITVGQVRLHSQLHYMTMPSSQYTF